MTLSQLVNYSTIALTGITLAYVIATFLTLKEIKRQREQSARPYVIVDFIIDKDAIFMYLIIKNIGNTMAQNIKITEVPVFVQSFHFEEYNPKNFKDGLKFLPPGKQVDTFYDSLVDYCGKKLPMSYTVTVSYEDAITGKQYEERYDINLDPYACRLRLGK